LAKIKIQQYHPTKKKNKLAVTMNPDIREFEMKESRAAMQVQKFMLTLQY
jgi:hypothetical protein